MIPQVGGFQGCYLDNHRNNWCCARTVRALCLRCAKTPPRGLDARPVSLCCMNDVHVKGTGCTPGGQPGRVLVCDPPQPPPPPWVLKDSGAGSALNKCP